MKVQQFLDHHGIKENPFGQEDAQSDHVFKEFCLNGTHHPVWDKIFSNPANPSTSVVFGEKGAGKTAIRMQMIEQLQNHNAQHPENRVFVIEYDDFNPFLDCFRERYSGRNRRPERLLSHWRLWDHMDAILSLGVTQLIGEMIEPNNTEENNIRSVTKAQVNSLTHLEKRDLLLLAAFYDHSLDMPAVQRWNRLRKRLKFSYWKTEWERSLGFLVTIVTVALVFYLGNWKDFQNWWIWLIMFAGWTPWLWKQLTLMWKAWRVSREVRVFDHLSNALRKILSRIERRELAGQPIPCRDRSDDRYELLTKFQTILKKMGFENIVILVDRVDEPHLVNGSAERMRDLLWPMFDNKLLKHPGVAFKLLLPSDVVYYLQREEKEFYERSRLDKQNLITSLDWTGESLYDVASDRIRACTADHKTDISIRDMFDESISEQELIGQFAQLRVPRHLFKFLYRLLVDHCNRYTVDNPSWKINRETLHKVMSLFQRDLEAFDRGMGTG
ncbi:MAG: hypothetical protein ACIAZJ_05255 [Gimesia chilikensis]|uniref:hypothetical protein n=1 Tax=Gimesia chilikensis TaxID=2605989 RepID=UPI0037B52BF7